MVSRPIGWRPPDDGLDWYGLGRGIEDVWNDELAEAWLPVAQSKWGTIDGPQRVSLTRMAAEEAARDVFYCWRQDSGALALDDPERLPPPTPAAVVALLLDGTLLGWWRGFYLFDAYTLEPKETEGKR